MLRRRIFNCKLIAASLRALNKCFIFCIMFGCSNLLQAMETLELCEKEVFKEECNFCLLPPEMLWEVSLYLPLEGVISLASSSKSLYCTFFGQAQKPPLSWIKRWLTKQAKDVRLSEKNSEKLGIFQAEIKDKLTSFCFISSLNKHLKNTPLFRSLLTGTEHYYIQSDQDAETFLNISPTYLSHVKKLGIKKLNRTEPITIWKFIEQFPALEDINIEYDWNRYDKEIDLNLSNGLLPNLKSLHFKKVNIKNVDLALARNLKELSLVRGSLSKVTSLPKNLEILDMDNMNLTEIPSAIKKLSKLKRLNLNSNYLKPDQTLELPNCWVTMWDQSPVLDFGKTRDVAGLVFVIEMAVSLADCQVNLMGEDCPNFIYYIVGELPSSFSQRVGIFVSFWGFLTILIRLVHAHYGRLDSFDP